MRELTKDERSLLLFFETCAVDGTGRVNTQHMNADDHEIAERWNEEGFVEFGRIAYDDLRNISRACASTHWCWLSEEAWEEVHKLRQARANRMWENRTYRKTSEKEQP